MKKYLYTSLLIASAALILSALYSYLPAFRAARIYSSMAEGAGLVKKKIDVNGYAVHYYESLSGKGDAIILLHGLGGDKTSFIQTASGLSRSFLVILPDLAGHGENSRTGYSDFSIGGQADFVRAFAGAKGLKDFHIGGNSMGGHISAAFTLKFPEMVKSLILINSTGISMEGNYAYTGYGAPVKSIGELRSAMSFGYNRVPEINPLEALYMMRKHNRSYEFITGSVIPAIRNGTYFNLSQDLSKIRIPALIIWGANDRVVSVKTGERFRREIRNSRLVIIENTSHTPQVEAPERISEEIKKFILSQPKN